MTTTRALHTAAAALMTAAIVLSTGPTLTTPTDADAAPAEAAPVVGEAVPTAPYDHEMVDWAYGLYESAGLGLPDVEIRFYDTPLDCDDKMGAVRRISDGTKVVSICAHHDKPEVKDRWRRKTLVHELAHVWEQARVTDDTRHAFLDLRGLTDWNDRSQGWAQRGTEHAAEVVTWSLLDFSYGFASMPDNSCAEFTEAYRALTGLEPLNGTTVNCD